MHVFIDTMMGTAALKTVEKKLLATAIKPALIFSMMVAEKKNSSGIFLFKEEGKMTAKVDGI